ncbi:MAG: hypothetical protein ACE148_09035 [Vicinamibacterales bacterium]
MDLVLTVVILGIAEVVVLGMALRAFDRAEERRAQLEVPRSVKREQAPGRFFADPAVSVTYDRARLDSLLMQLERHVRLEQAAAESFLQNPTAESLHHRTSSPFQMAN